MVLVFATSGSYDAQRLVSNVPTLLWLWHSLHFG